LTLLPKKEISETPNEFRPISLIHSFAKLVSKVLALRLSPHMDTLVSNDQSAFIKNRCIQDNFVYVINLARVYHRKKTTALLMKIDITKVFDSVSWEYLLDLLQHRGFSVRWHNWLSLLLASSSSNVRLNGVCGPWIKHKRGLIQGDPLSPLLFIIEIDTLQFIF
jgi:retron-type reverse transcriptase